MPSETGPQATPLENGAGEMKVLLKGTWPQDCPQRRFVEGASWWQFHANGATAFPSERDEMEAEAARRFGEPEREPDIRPLQLLPTTRPHPECEDEEEDGRVTHYGDLTELVRLFREEFVEEGRRGDDEGWSTDETAARLIRHQAAEIARLAAPAALSGAPPHA